MMERVHASPEFPIRTRPRAVPSRGGRRVAPRRQRGVALIVALLLLIVITLIGFAAVRSTVMQQKMSSNLYDREVAFQAAEAAMRAASAIVVTQPTLVARNCRAGGVVCMANPFNDPNLPAGSIHDVPSGAGVGQFNASTVSASQPQYVIEDMGNWVDPTSNTGFNQTANSRNYGAQGSSTTATYYRITARSGDPTAVANKNRAIVTLQAMVKRN